MLRTRATSLYGWDILLRGTLWPGPVIGEKLSSVIRSTSDAGHEVGLHAWDHYTWQAHIDEMEDDRICETLGRGVEILTEILGCPPSCSASPGWKCNDKVLLAKSQFPFNYNSDCRGESIFWPIVGGREIPQPQIPVTLPTYDEVVGRNGVTHGTYNDYMLTLLDPQKLNVLTIHAEVEGIACLDTFEQFVKKALTKGASFVPLGVLLREYPETGSSAIVAKEIPGREGWICCQVSARVDNGND
jgi:undecaprenyl phosphate-alpha-L-ara4FN deformylase